MELSRLTTEAQNPASAEIDCWSSLEIVRLMNVEDATVAEAVGREAERIAAAVDVIVDRLRSGGRLIYLGAGTSGRLGILDASECPPTFNSPPWQVVGLIAGGPTALTRAVEGAEDVPDAAVRDLQMMQLSDRDVVVGIATSGRTPYVLGGLAYANQTGAFAIGLTCNADSELADVSRLMIVPVVGPEVISGSTRMKAGTATKLVLNTLTTAAMVQLGKTYGNLMVDLQATNQKLARRARRIVAMLTGLAPAAAEPWLDRCYGDTKTAIVAHRRQISPAAAERLLAACGGQLRPALERPLNLEDLTREGRQLPGVLPPDMPLTARGDADKSPASPADQLVLGVDGGGTKTRVWLARAEHAPLQVIGRGEAGPGNPQAVGWATALDNVDSAIDRAFAAAGLPRGTVQAVCLALAGAGRDEDQQRLDSWAHRRRVAHAIRVTHDALPVLAASTPDGVGIALIAGTGSLVFGRNSAGQSARAGGWGYLLGDEGSGYWLACAALRAVVAAWDGRAPDTSLAGRLLEAVGTKTSADLVREVYQRSADRCWLASLASVVIAAADEGDAVAQRLVAQAAADLAEQCVCVADRLGFAGDHDSLPIAMSGGLLIHAPLLQEQLIRTLRGGGLRNPTITVVAEPLVGALQLAVQIIPLSSGGT